MCLTHPPVRTHFFAPKEFKIIFLYTKLLFQYFQIPCCCCTRACRNFSTSSLVIFVRFANKVMVRSSFTLFLVWIAKRALFSKSLARFGFGGITTGSACAGEDMGVESVSTDSGSGTSSETNGSLSST